MDEVVTQVLPEDLYDPARLKDEFYCNPTGRFVIGGPVGDTGLTGRKIIVDTYGGFARHGGGAFSGKDPSKVDRSAAYAARYVAKNIVAACLADRAEVQVAYAIGVARPLSLLIETFGTEKISARHRRAGAGELRPAPGRDPARPGAAPPVYRPTAAYGHFGRSGDAFTWERTDKADQLRTQAGLDGALRSAANATPSPPGRQRASRPRDCTAGYVAVVGGPCSLKIVDNLANFCPCKMFVIRGKIRAIGLGPGVVVTGQGACERHQ